MTVVKSDELRELVDADERGRAARHRLHLHRGADLERRGRVPAVQRHARRRAPALERGRRRQRGHAARPTSATAWSTTPTATCSSASTSPARSCASTRTASARRSPRTSAARSSTARTTSSRARDGTIYFSDPWYGRMPVFGVERERELGFQGVYRIPAGGGELELVVAEDEFEHAERAVLLARRVAALHQRHAERARSACTTSTPTARSSNGRLFFDGIGDGVIEDGVRRRDEVRRARQHLGHRPGRRLGRSTRAGEHLGVIEMPENIGNLAWGGAGLADAVHPAARRRVYRIETKVASARLPYH